MTQSMDQAQPSNYPTRRAHHVSRGLALHRHPHQIANNLRTTTTRHLQGDVTLASRQSFRMSTHLQTITMQSLTVVQC